MVETTTETVASLRAAQVVWPEWMAEATEGATEVSVTRNVTPFGSYVLAVSRKMDA